MQPSWRRNGVGERLLQEVIRAAEAGKSTIYLEVAIDNTAAIALYKKAGFEQTGMRKGYYARENGKVDAVLLTRYS